MGFRPSRTVSGSAQGPCLVPGIKHMQNRRSAAVLSVLSWLLDSVPFWASILYCFSMGSGILLGLRNL